MRHSVPKTNLTHRTYGARELVQGTIDASLFYANNICKLKKQPFTHLHDGREERLRVEEPAQPRHRWGLRWAANPVRQLRQPRLPARKEKTFDKVKGRIFACSKVDVQNWVSTAKRHLDFGSPGRSPSYLTF